MTTCPVCGSGLLTDESLNNDRVITFCISCNYTDQIPMLPFDFLPGCS